MIGLKDGSFVGLVLTGGPGKCVKSIRGCGTVLQIVPPAKGKTSWKTKVLHVFSGPDGSFPQSNLVRDGAGNLYGVTVGGGANTYGTVFKLTPPSQRGGVWTLTTEWAFAKTDGANPGTHIAMDKAGNIYGTTEEGGATNEGTVWMLTP